MAMRPKLKVRTGCTTCKLRKVKCDEEKPFCNRCKASGRMCEGYATAELTIKPSPIPEQNMAIVQSKPRARSKNLLPGLVSNIDPLLSLPLDLDESKWLHFFSSHTGPALTPFSDDHAFWSKHVPLLGVAEPAIRHALLAVASFHARFETMHGAANASRSVACCSFTVKHYNLAIRELQHAIDNKSSRLEVPLVCCLLFVLLECLYGNYPLVLTHVRNGQNILKLPEFHLTGDGETLFVRKKLKQIFNKLLAHSTLFGAPPITSAPHPLDNEESVNPTHHDPFVDAVDAKSCLDIIISLSLNYVKSLHDDSGQRKPPGTVNNQPLQRSLKDRLIAWGYRLEASESMVPQRISPDDPSVIMLKIEHRAAFVYLSRCHEVEESSYDTHGPSFVQIIKLYRALNEKQPRKDSRITALLSRAFSLDSSCVPALFLVAFKCRDPVLRREAIALLETNPCREGLWDAALHAKIGRRVVELEEANMLLFEGAEYAAMEEAPSTRMIASNGAVVSKWPLERFRVYNIRRTSEDPARSARVTFFTAPYGFDGQKVVWDEDFEF